MSKYWCVVPAGGVGKRMGSHLPKQYLPLDNKTVAECTLDRLLQVPQLEKIVVAISDSDERWKTLSVSQHSKISRCEAGSERVHSVLNGLNALTSVADQEDWVLVHDIARPCVRVSDIQRLISTLSSHSGGDSDSCGGLLGVPVADTIKRTDANKRVVTTVNREGIWRAFTPQMFRFGALKASIEAALKQAVIITDEASALEAAGESPLMVEGRGDNIKITHPQDLALAAHYLSLQKIEMQ